MAYDLASKSIKCNLTFDSDNTAYKSEKKFIQIDQIVLFYNLAIGNSVSSVTLRPGDTYTTHTIKLPLANESTALKIEENAKSVRFLYIFSFMDKTEPYQPELYNWITNYRVFGTIEKIVAFNTNTGEIYFEINKPKPK